MNGQMKGFVNGVLFSLVGSAGSANVEALTSSDGYALQDKNGLYLIPKED